MKERVLKEQVGRTPLTRAHNLEKKLGLSKIYLKLEGNNPSGYTEDRLAYLIIREALSKKKKTICLGTSGTVGGSLAYLAPHFGVKCVFYVPKKNKLLRKKMFSAPNVKIIEHGKTYQDCVQKSREESQKNGWYSANPGLENDVTNMYAFSSIAREILKQAGIVDTVFCQTSNGASVSGVHLGFKEKWTEETIPSIPRIIAASTAHGNAIIESHKKNSEKIIPLEEKEIQETKHNQNMVNRECFNGQSALNAIYDSEGTAIGVTDQELLKAHKEFKKIEDIKLKKRNCFPIAAFLKAVEKGLVSNGVHVIILNDGKADVSVKAIEKRDLNIPYQKFLKKLDRWLVQYTDPMEEIQEAVDDAFENGFVVCAYRGNELVGVSIVSTSKYKTFFPRFHLSYLATQKDTRGMGIATQLMQKVIDLTDGNFSLHVETENKKAARLYEKMGLKKKYYRMFYEGGSPNNP
jgi:threonine synthase